MERGAVTGVTASLLVSAALAGGCAPGIASRRPGDDAAYLVVNLAREIEPGTIVFTGVNSTVPVAACLLAKRTLPLPFTWINVAGGVDPQLDRLPASSGDPALLTGTAA